MVLGPKRARIGSDAPSKARVFTNHYPLKRPRPKTSVAKGSTPCYNFIAALTGTHASLHCAYPAP